MGLPDRDRATSWEGLRVVDRSGEPLGTCGGVFADTETGATEWLDVSLPAFFVGSTLRYISDCQKAKPDNRRLNRIELPEQYR